MAHLRNSLQIAHRHENGACVLSATGFVDLSTRLKLSTALNDVVSQENKSTVVVDLCGVEFIDSTGLGVLMSTLRRLTRQDRTLRLACPPGGVRRVFEITGLDGTFSMHDSLAEALRG